MPFSFSSVAVNGDIEQLHEFFKEMNTLASVGSHANIVSLLGVCTQGGVWRKHSGGLAAPLWLSLMIMNTEKLIAFCYIVTQ